MKGFIQIGETQHEIYNAPNKTKVPETLFYNNYQVSGLEFDFFFKVTTDFDELVLLEHILTVYT